MRTKWLLLCVAIVGGGIASGVSAAARAQPATVACREVPEAETHLAVLLSRADVMRVEPLRRGDHAGDPLVPSGEGARIVLAAQPFVSMGWLQQAIDCHLARIVAEKWAARADRSPLDVEGARVVVGGTPGELFVNVVSDDRAAAREILTRALVLVPPPPR